MCPRVVSTSVPPASYEELASRGFDGQDGEALLDLAAQGLDMQPGDGLDGGPARGIEVPEVDEVVGQRSGPVARPGGEGGEERPLVDQAVLEGKQAEEQVTRRVGRFRHRGASQSIRGGAVPRQCGLAVSIVGASRNPAQQTGRLAIDPRRCPVVFRSRPSFSSTIVVSLAFSVRLGASSCDPHRLGRADDAPADG